MNVLFIVHATAWSDKESIAKEPIQRLISEGRFDQIIEIIQSRPDIKDQRYLSHDGLVLEHDEISPVPFLANTLFGENPVFPAADSVAVVGGWFNAGEGCLNVAFEHMVRYYQRIGGHCEITVPLSATYRRAEVEQCVKDLERILSLACHETSPLIRLRIEE